MNHLKISLLGPFNVTLGGVALTQFSTDTTRALLAYLAMNVDIAYPRATLAGLLWPDQPDSMVLNNLRQTLIRLRRAIEDHDAEPHFLISNRQSIQFNVQSAYDLDVTAFIELIAETKKHNHRRLTACPLCMRRLTEAATLYRGNFLMGFMLDSMPFEEWLMLQRENLHRQAMNVFFQLATYYERRGDYARAQHYARRQIALEHWREEAHGQLMRALALSGQRSAALAQYEVCRLNLQDEFGVAPDPEITALHDKIQAGLLRPSQRAFHNLPAQLTSFIGREAELTQLIDWLPNPAYRLITIVGPGGVGKTRLALSAVESMLGSFKDGVWFVPLADIGQAVSGESYLPLAGALSDVLDVLPAISNKDLPHRVIDYLRDKEMLLLLDDLKPAVLPQCVEFILELLQRAPNISILVTAHQRLNFQAEYVLNLRGLSAPESIEDPAAGEYDCVRLFVERAKRTAGNFTLDKTTLAGIVEICRIVGGSPLGVELSTVWTAQFSPDQIARAVRQDIEQLATTAWDISKRHQSLWTVFDRAWEQLSQDARCILAQTTVFSGSFDEVAALSILLPANAGAPSMVIDILEKLVQVALLQKTSSRRYKTHDLLRQFSTEKLQMLSAEKFSGTVHLQARHSEFYLTFLGRCSKALNGTDAQKTATEIHEEIDNVRKAWRWAALHSKVGLLDFGLEGLAHFLYLRGLFEEGETLFEIAAWRLRPLLEEQDPDSPERAYALKKLLSRLLILQAKFLNALSHYERARNVARAAVAEAPFDLASLGGGVVRDIVGIQAAGYLEWGASLWPQGKYAAAREQLHQALLLARIDAPLVAAETLFQLSFIHMREANYGQAWELAKQALLIYQQLGDWRGASKVLDHLGTVTMPQGHYDQTRYYFEESLRIARELGDWLHERRVLINIGVLLMRRGHHTEALSYFERARQSFRESGVRRGEIFALLNLGDVFLRLGHHDKAQDALNKALQISQGFGNKGMQLGDKDVESEILSLMALLFHQTDQQQSALEWSQRAMRLAESIGNRDVLKRALMFWGHALLALQRPQRAKQAYDQALQLHGKIGHVCPDAELLAGMARVALMQGDAAGALPHIELILRGIKRDPTLCGVYELGRVNLTCVQVLQANNDPRAPEVLRAAYKLLQTRYSKITDSGFQRSYLKNVSAHVDLIAAYKNLAVVEK